MPRRFFLLAAGALLSWAVCLPAAQTPGAGSIEFSARITPAGGRPEPVLRLPFYLLRKSFADIRKAAEESVPKPGQEKFVDSLSVSKELKAWMKAKKTLQLTGEDFMRKMSIQDTLDVPEFYEAYLAQNVGDTAVGFPKPRHKDKDRAENPARFEQSMKEFHAQVRKFLQDNPHTREGMDLHLVPIDPAQLWVRQDAERARRVRNRSFELAETRYLVARLESSLDGRGAFSNIPPGDYWLSTLETDALAGDVRLRWDAHVTVYAGRATRVELSNVNAVDRPPSPR